MKVYYNEWDKFAAAWLRELIKAGELPDGEVDERSITDVQPEDVRGFDQCHWFAGIGVWADALCRAGWSDEAPVWTGSCPCQSFSASGKGAGFDDARHLWPAWHRLIREHRPGVIFGEQVASQAGLAWLDVVSADLEDAGYAIGPADVCAAGIGAPHIRQRLWFVADTESRAGRLPIQQRRPLADRAESVGSREAGALDNAERRGAERSAGDEGRAERTASIGRQDQGRRQLQTVNAGALSELEHADRAGRQSGGTFAARAHGHDRGRELESTGPLRGFWADAEWLYCRDDKWRPIEPGTFPLVTGAPARVGRLRGYGNAINAEVAAEFIGAYLDVRGVADAAPRVRTPQDNACK